MSNLIRALAFITFAFILSLNALCNAEEGVSFNSPDVMNLSGFLRQARPPSQGYVTIKTDTLSLDIAKLIISARQRGWNDPEVISYTEKFTYMDEKKRIADDKKSVSRVGKTLIIKPESAPPIIFKDWFLSGKGQGEDDKRSFLYLGKIVPNGFYRVEAHYMHDSPGSFFINPKKGRILYAHNGTDTVALSPNGKRIVVMNDGLNPPFGLVVADIGIDNPSLELYCRCHTIAGRAKMTPVFKGWHIGDYIGFDLMLIVQQDQTVTMATFLAIPIRFSLKGDGWHVSAPNILDLDRVVGLSCYQRPNF